jgi:RHH-type proline utilization regulon transcriptional repressor/proline dehydrogenase/delta 1-pyrroline-5-carboxylate dehydrogenase
MDFTEIPPRMPCTPRPDSDLGLLLVALQGWDTLNLAENSRLIAAFTSYEQAWEAEFSVTHDHFRLLGQDNLRLYRPFRELRIRIHPADSPFDLFARVAAARQCGCRITVSYPPGFEWRPLDRLHTVTEAWAGNIEFVAETEEELAEVLLQGQTDRVRFAGPDRVPESLRRATVETGIFLGDSPVRMEGRVELLWYLQEQSISHDYHRYGNLSSRAGEARARPE